MTPAEALALKPGDEVQVRHSMGKQRALVVRVSNYGTSVVVRKFRANSARWTKNLTIRPEEILYLDTPEMRRVRMALRRRA